LKTLREYVEELEKHQKLTAEQFKRNRTVRLAVERALQGAVEACSDVCSHVVSAFGFRRPDQLRDVYGILADEGLLDRGYAQRMQEMVGLRNRIVHLYWDLDADKLYGYLQNDVESLKRFEVFCVQLIENAQTRGSDR